MHQKSKIKNHLQMPLQMPNHMEGAQSSQNDCGTKQIQEDSGTDREPGTGTVGTVFPGTESEDFSLLVAFLLVTFSWLFRGFFVAFFVALFCLEKQCSGLFRYFFVVFSWLFRGFFVAPVLGKFYAYSPWNSLLTESGTGTAGTVFQEPKPEPEPSFPVKNVLKHRKALFCRGTAGTENRNRSNRSTPKRQPNRTGASLQIADQNRQEQ